MACVDSEWERACWTIWDELHPLRVHAIQVVGSSSYIYIYQDGSECVSLLISWEGRYMRCNWNRGSKPGQGWAPWASLGHLGLVAMLKHSKAVWCPEAAIESRGTTPPGKGGERCQHWVWRRLKAGGTTGRAVESVFVFGEAQMCWKAVERKLSGEHHKGTEVTKWHLTGAPHEGNSDYINKSSSSTPGLGHWDCVQIAWLHNLLLKLGIHLRKDTAVNTEPF